MKRVIALCFILSVCLGIYLPLIIGHPMGANAYHRTGEDLYPTLSAIRSLKRLFGTRSEHLYRFTDQVSRHLEADDISALLFQEHVELQPKFRTQYLLANRRRQAMVKTLVSTAPPLVLPSILSMLQYDLEKIKNGNASPLFTSEQLETINKLQQIQQPAIEQYRRLYQSYSLVNDHTSTMNEINNNSRNHHHSNHSDTEDDSTDPTSPQSNGGSGHAKKLQQLASLDLLTSPVGHFNPLLSSKYMDNDTTTPLLESIDEYDIKVFPIILISPSISTHYTSTNQPIAWTAHDEDILLELQQHHDAIEMSKSLLIDSLTSIGSHFYVEDDNAYLFWRLLFTHTISPSHRESLDALHVAVDAINRRVGGDGTLSTLLKEDDTVQHMVTKLNNLRMSDSFDWFTGYDLGALPSLERYNHHLQMANGQPSHVGDHQKTLETLRRDIQSDGQVTGVITQQKILNDYIFNLITSIPSSLIIPLPNQVDDETNHSHQHQHQKQSFTEIMKHIKQLYSTTQSALPTLSIINRYHHLFFSYPDQEELLLNNIDVEAIVKSSLITSLTKAYDQQYFSDRINDTIRHHLAQSEHSGILRQAAKDLLIQEHHRRLQQQREQRQGQPGYEDKPLSIQDSHLIDNEHMINMVESHLQQVYDNIKEMIITTYTHHATTHGIIAFIPQFTTFLEQVIESKKDYLHLKDDENELLQKILNSIADKKTMHMPTNDVDTNNTNNAGTNDNTTTFNHIEQLPTSPHGGLLSTRDLFIDTHHAFTSITRDNNQFFTTFSTTNLHGSSNNNNDNDTTCEECRSEYTKKMQDLERELPAQLVNLVEPLCRTIWPVIGPTFGDNLCDPLVEGECYALCMGMVEGYKEAIAQVMAFMKFSPDKQCFKENKCPYDPSTDYPPIPDIEVDIDKTSRKAGQELWLHVTDQHLDLDYTPGSTNVVCKMPVCCFDPKYKTVEAKAYQHGYGSVGEYLRDRGYVMENGQLIFDGDRHSDIDHDHDHDDLDISATSKHEHRARELGEFECDAPHKLLISLNERILIHCPHISFVTGDLPAHDLWKQTKIANLNTIHNVTSTLKDAFRLCNSPPYREYHAFNLNTIPYVGERGGVNHDDLVESEAIRHQRELLRDRAGVSAELDQQLRKHIEVMPPEERAEVSSVLLGNNNDNNDKMGRDYEYTRFFSSIGNHAAAPVNQFSGYPLYDSWLLDVLAGIWSDNLSATGKQSLQYGGYFHQVIGPDLSVISLHTGLYDTHNPWRILDLTHWDPAGQLKWLEEHLKILQKEGSKVVLMMHEPLRSLIKGAARNYLKGLYHKYHDTIQVILAGHVHTDHTWLLYDTLEPELESMPTIPQWLVNPHGSGDTEPRLVKRQSHHGSSNVDGIGHGVDVYISLDGVEMDIASGVSVVPHIPTTSKDDYVIGYQHKHGHFAYHYLESIAKRQAALHHPSHQPSLSSPVFPSSHDGVLQRQRGGRLTTHDGSTTLDTTFTITFDENQDTSSAVSLERAKQHPLYDKKPITVELVAPSLTPFEYHTNPSYRIITYNRAGVVPVFTQYRLDIDDQLPFAADISSDNPLVKGAQWYVAFTTRKTYEMDDVSPQSYHDLAFQIAQSMNMTKTYFSNVYGGVTKEQNPRQEDPWTPMEAACEILGYDIAAYKECLDGW